MTEETMRWIKQADHDLELARRNMEIEGYDVCAFLCQQAVEKYFKALYLQKFKSPPPKTHYLDELGKKVKCPSDILDLAKELSGDYMISRYPDVASAAPFEEYSREDAEEKIASAEQIIAWIKGNMK
ncbi:MAG: HEPN domain-containing protein [bacterium]